MSEPQPITQPTQTTPLLASSYAQEVNPFQREIRRRSSVSSANRYRPPRGAIGWWQKSVIVVIAAVLFILLMISLLTLATDHGRDWRWKDYPGHEHEPGHNHTTV